MKDDFSGNPLWDYRHHRAARMHFMTDNGERLDDIKRRALTVLRSYCEGAELGTHEIAAPLWALVDVTHKSQAVKGACDWFRAAAAYQENEELRRALLIEAYGKIERALRCYL